MDKPTTHSHLAMRREYVMQDRLAELLILEEAIRRSGFDVSPCLHCGMPVVCLPDGMPCCEECAGEVGT